MKTARFVYGLIVVVLFATTAALAPAPNPPTIRVMSIGIGSLTVRVAQTNGLFAKYGIEVRNSSMPLSDTMRGDLASGKIDVAHAAVDNAVAMVELAGADVIIVMGGDGSQYELMAQPDNKSVNDLLFKTLIVDAPNTAYALQMKKILMLNGVRPGIDCEIKPLAVTPQRLVAMRENKNYAASMMGPPTSILARRDGFVSLGSVPELIGRYQAGGAFVRRQWAEDHADSLERYIAANVEAQRWIMSPANRREVIELIARESKIPADVAAETYELEMNASGGWARDARFDLEGFKNALKLRAEVEGSWGGKPPAPDRYYDLSYYQKALAMLKSGK